VIDASKVSCVIVTRGNVDLRPVVDSLPFEDIVIWDNSKAPTDSRVFGRYYGATMLAKNDVVAVQDDDAIIEDWPAILEAYEPGVIACNMGAAHRAYYAPMGLALVGFGAVFDRSLIASTFDQYFAQFPKDELFLRECDRVFTGLNKLKPITVPYRNLPHEETTERMWRESRHGDDLLEIRHRILKVFENYGAVPARFIGDAESSLRRSL
jgi:hypothetical protein